MGFKVEPIGSLFPWKRVVFCWDIGWTKTEDDVSCSLKKPRFWLAALLLWRPVFQKNQPARSWRQKKGVYVCNILYVVFFRSLFSSQPNAGQYHYRRASIDNSFVDARLEAPTILLVEVKVTSEPHVPPPMQEFWHSTNHLKKYLHVLEISVEELDVERERRDANSNSHWSFISARWLNAPIISSLHPVCVWHHQRGTDIFLALLCISGLIMADVRHRSPYWKIHCSQSSPGDGQTWVLVCPSVSKGTVLSNGEWVRDL